VYIGYLAYKRSCQVGAPDHFYTVTKTPIFRILSCMTERELLKQLKNLKSVKPDSAWLKSNREILLAQVSNSGAEKLSAWTKVFIDLKSLVRTVSQPAFALGSFLVVLLGAGLFGPRILAGVKPNDSLYIARVISEKAHLNTVWNSEERDQLTLQYATDRAKDITTVLSDPSFNNDQHQDEVNKLNQNFNQEIAVVKTVINKIKPTTVTPAPEEEAVVSAESAKDKDGVQIYTQPNAQGVTPTAASTTKPASTGTEDAKAKDAGTSKNSQAIIDEAQKMFDNKEYSQALDKLKQVDELIKK